MQLKKLLQGSVFAAAVAVCAVAGAVSAEAATTAPTGTFTEAGVSSVSVDGTTQQLKATGSNGELLVGVGKVNAKKGTITVANWDVYDGTAATIDLSKLSNTKDNYLVLTANAKDVVSVIKIPAVDKAISASFNAAAAELKIGTGAKASDAKTAAKVIGADNTGYEYRTAYSSWADLADTSNKQVSLTTYQEEGATLYIRKKGTKTVTSPTQHATEKFTYNGQEAKVYVVDQLPGKEAKVNIPAKAKGPAVAVDYTKGTATLPAKSEYRLASATAIKDNSGKPIANAEKKPNTTIASIFTAVTETGKVGTLEVRTAAVDGKKAASKWTRVPVQVTEALPTTLLTAGNTAASKPSTADTEYGGGTTNGVAAAVLKETSTDTATVLKAEYVTVKKKDALKFTNSAKSTSYEIVTTAATETAVPDGAKPKKVAPGKNITVTGVADGSKVWVRIAGDKKTKTWVGVYTQMGVVDYKKKTDPAPATP